MNTAIKRLILVVFLGLELALVLVATTDRFSSVSVSDARSGTALWQDRVVGETSFSTGVIGSSSDRLRGNSQTFLEPVRSFQTSEENQAASEALERLAADIFYRTIEPW